MVAPPRESVRKLAERLIGSCEFAVDEINALSLEECRELDSIAFLCDGCGWWFHRYEMVADWKCEECQ